jgi:transposase InsO family protein
LADRDISMSRPGNPFDNAKAKSFTKTLKAEQVNGRACTDLGEARRHINSFIAGGAAAHRGSPLSLEVPCLTSGMQSSTVIVIRIARSKPAESDS